MELTDDQVRVWIERAESRGDSALDADRRVVQLGRALLEAREQQPAAGQSNRLQRAFDVAKAHRIATSTRTLEAYGMVVLRADVVDAVVRTEHAWVIARGLAFPKVKDLEPYESEAALRLQLAVGRLLAQLPKEEKDDG